MAQSRRPKLDEESVKMPSITRHVQTIHEHYLPLPPPHGNTQLTDENVLIILVAAFFEPLAKSQRCIEQLAQVNRVKQHLTVEGVPKSTLSDAMARFNVGNLDPLIKQLQDKLPHLQRVDPELKKIAGQIIAGDGSLFRMAGEVVWAIQRHKKNKDGPTEVIDSQCRLDLQVDIERWTIEDFRVSGKGDGGEAAVMGTMLKSNVLYLFDRGYYPFNFLRAILDRQSNFVVRFKKDLVFRVESSSPLSAKDLEAAVRKDEQGWVGVENGCKGKAPEQLLRLVTVWDDENQEEVRLLTSLLDVPAWIIGYLYRCRWIIELFLRWLKVTAGAAHLLSTSANGIRLQFYVAMICTLLIHIRTGLPVSKYSLYALGIVARGEGSYEDQLPIILKRERERMLEKARLSRKKASKINPA
jgi:hypothetical protein